MSTWIVSDELYHHGIKGQKWGIRRYQNEDGSLTPEGVKRYGVDSVTGEMSEKGMVKRLNDSIKETKMQYKSENRNFNRERNKAFWRGQVGKTASLDKEFRERTLKNFKASEQEFNLAIARAKFDDAKTRAIGNIATTAIIDSGIILGTVAAGEGLKAAKDRTPASSGGFYAKNLDVRNARTNLIGTAGIGAAVAGMNAGIDYLAVSQAKKAKKNLENAREEYNKKKGGR